MELIEIEGIEEVSKLYCCVCYYPSGKEYYAATPIETVWIGTGGDFYRTCGCNCKGNRYYRSQIECIEL